MKEQFVKQFIPNAKPVNRFKCKGIFCFENKQEFFALIDIRLVGTLTQSRIKKIRTKMLYSATKPIKFVSMYKTRNDFSTLGEIVWGAYAWFENEPNHFIHFDDKPYKIIS